ncbi:MAG: hypothetical protein LBT60_01190 [Oscillospiraceae bacterium]|nr:hypothetical protein [Oscillospiraceae bacterium]
MKHTNILSAIGGIDEELIERGGGVARPVRRARWLLWAAPAAACLVIAAAVGLPTLLKPSAPPNPDSGQPGLSAGAGDVGGATMPQGAIDKRTDEVFLDDLVGLPAGDYTWDEGDVAADRLATDELRYLMREFDSYDPTVKAAFTVIRAEGTEGFAEEGQTGQIAVGAVLFDVFGDELPGSVSIKQYLCGGCTGDEETNLLRAGGVYVLPLWQRDGEENWHIYGDLDVLFEVDDKGLIHSHSRCPALNQYDGQDLATLWKAIGYLDMNPLLRSPFAEYIANGYVIDSTEGTIVLYYPEWGWDERDAAGFRARIGADGRIVVPGGGFNVFAPVSGLTVAEVYDAIEEIERYIGRALSASDAATEPNNTSDARPTPIDGSANGG